MVHFDHHPVHITLHARRTPENFEPCNGDGGQSCFIFIHKLGTSTIGIKDMVFIIYFAFVGYCFENEWVYINRIREGDG
jgi:hypothetical protein